MTVHTTLVNPVLLLLLSLLCKCFILDVQNFRSCMCQRKIWWSLDEMLHIDSRIKLLIFLAFHRSYFLWMGKARFNKLFPSLCLLVPSLIVQYCVCPIWILSKNMLLPWSYRKFIFVQNGQLIKLVLMFKIWRHACVNAEYVVFSMKWFTSIA